MIEGQKFWNKIFFLPFRTGCTTKKTGCSVKLKTEISRKILNIFFQTFFYRKGGSLPTSYGRTFFLKDPPVRTRAIIPKSVPQKPLTLVAFSLAISNPILTIPGSFES